MAKPRSHPESESGQVAIRALTPRDWPAIESLFGERGGCGGCWCMTWRLPRVESTWAAHKGEPNRLALKALVESGTARGCIAFADGAAVGWCSAGPKSDFPKIARSRVLDVPGPVRAWAVTCFLIPRAWRGRGVGTALLLAAKQLAAAEGAEALDGYPAALPANGSPLPAAFAWTGVPSMFRAAGFAEITPPGQSRPVFRWTPPKSTRGVRRARAA